MNRDGVIIKLRRRLNGCSQKDLAAQFKISPAFLCDVLRGYREPSVRILKPLGLQRVVIYKPL